MALFRNENPVLGSQTQITLSNGTTKLLTNIVAFNFSDAENPSGTVPGNSFTLAHAPSPAASLILTLNGMVLKAVTDYTLAGNTLTTVQTVQSSDSFLAWYRY